MHADTLSWVVAALMVATFSCCEARLLRPLAVATNVAFVGYGVMASLPPVLVLHLLLLPINLWRCVQVYGVGAKALSEAADRGPRLPGTIALASLPLRGGRRRCVDLTSIAPLPLPMSLSPSSPLAAIPSDLDQKPWTCRP